jgi:hypothetical protein
MRCTSRRWRTRETRRGCPKRSLDSPRRAGEGTDGPRVRRAAARGRVAWP